MNRENCRTYSVLGKARIIPAALLILFFGCKAPDKGYDLYIYSPLNESTPNLEEAVKAYTSETGVRVKLSSPLPGGDYAESLKAELETKNKPEIFFIRGTAELQDLRKEGFVQNLIHAEDSFFTELVSIIDPSLRFGIEENTSYGIPVTVQGYGYIADRRLLTALFGAGSENTLIADIKTASYDEWIYFISTIERWILYPFPYRVFLSGRLYLFASARLDPAANLDRVFSNGESQGEEALRTFMEGRALFFTGGSQTHTDIARRNIPLASRLEFLPLKERFGRSLLVYVPSYYAVNAIASMTEKKRAYDFLCWIFASGRDFLAEDNALGLSVLDYIKSGNFIVIDDSFEYLENE